MKKFVSESWLVLTLGVMFAALLAGAQAALSPRILLNQTGALNEAVVHVVPNTERIEKLSVAGYDRDVFRCTDAGGELVGWAIDASGVGFVDKIRLVVGLSPDCTQITGLKVIENVETPGLGYKIVEEEWAGQYRGLDATRPIVTEKRAPIPDRNEVQAITGATISSNVVTEIVNQALARVRPELEKRP